MSINSCTFSGNLTSDAKVSTYRKADGTEGHAVNFGIAVGGRGNAKPQFLDMTLYGREKAAAYLTKGVKVCVQCKARYSSWERDGQKRSKVDFVVDEFEFMSSRGEHPAVEPAPAEAYPMSDVDIPF